MSAPIVNERRRDWLALLMDGSFTFEDGSAATRMTEETTRVRLSLLPNNFYFIAMTLWKLRFK